MRARLANNKNTMTKILKDQTILPISDVYTPLSEVVAGHFGYVPGGSRTPEEAITEWFVNRREEVRNRFMAGVVSYFGASNQEAINEAMAQYDANIQQLTEIQTL